MGPIRLGATLKLWKDTITGSSRGKNPVNTESRKRVKGQ
jgi:hypothetical protein